MSKTDSWLPLYIADYLADTTRLTTEQHGAYLLLIMDYWRNGPPPDDDVVLARITGLTPSRWKGNRHTLQAFFQLVGGVWHHRRVDAELNKANTISKARQEAGKRGGKARANTVANTDQNATPSQSQSQSPTHSPPPEHPQPPKTISPVVAKPATHPARGNGKSETLTTVVWGSYAQAYRARYMVDPVRNAKVNGQLSQLVQRLGADEAPSVAAFYVRHNKGLYVSSKHCVDLLLRDCEGLRTEWATGRTVTDTEARQADRKQSNLSVAEKLIAEARTNAGK